MTVNATLCYIISRGKVLLIKKKKGLGEGLWNGPGGRQEKDETLQDCAKRETFEEVGIVPEAPQQVGRLKFYYGQSNEVDWDVHVFVADEFDGIEKETDEAAPRWFRIANLPFNEMWPDDKIWMPLMFAGKKFEGDLYYDKDAKNLLRHEIREVDGF